MNYYVTTSIPYVNGEPHIGHALEFIMADVVARAARKRGNTVIYSTGTDEHGGKIAEKAAELKLEPKVLADKLSDEFRALLKELNISNDRFVRTTDKGHMQRAQIIWKNLEKDIYKSKYVGWYCTGDEEFFSESVVQANKGICPDHNRPYERLEEENYFFKLSKYTPQIEKAITDGSFRVIPTTRRNEILRVIKDGLEDISVSRPKDKISWGIPVPGDTTQVMYVWFEALMNYLTVLGYPEHEDYKKFWPANVQVVGKGIIRFHAAIWPGMLFGLGLPLPKNLFVHGYVTVEGKKMGKSLGNSVAPSEIIKKYGADPFRYFFLRHIPSYEDGDFSWERLDQAYNNELADELGNAVQRTLVMIQKYQQGLIGDIPPAKHDSAAYWEYIDKCHFDKALDEVWEQVRGINQYIEEEKPWELANNKETEHLQEVLSYQVSALLEISDLLEPFLPQTALKIKHIFHEGVIRVPKTTLFPKQEAKSKS